jgi:hypothetical protein
MADGSNWYRFDETTTQSSVGVCPLLSSGLAWFVGKQRHAGIGAVFEFGKYVREY